MSKEHNLEDKDKALHIGSVSHSFFVGMKIPHLKYGYLKVMAYADGYYMARYKGCVPFCCTEKELIKRSINCG